MHSKRPTGPTNPAEHPDYFKKLGAENDAQILKELRFISTAMLALILIGFLWTILGIAGALYFYHALTATSGHVIPFGG